MPNIFQELGSKISNMLVGKSVTWKISKEKIVELSTLQLFMLKGLQTTLNERSAKEYEDISIKYFKLPFNTSDKNDVSSILLNLSKQYTGKASTADKRIPLFGAPIATINLLIKFYSEMIAHSDSLIEFDEVEIFNSKLSTVLILGILQETEMFIDYTSYLYNHVVEAVTKTSLVPMGYRAKYLQTKFTAYVNMVNDVINKEENYSVLKDIKSMRQNSSDLVLQVNNQSFLPSLNQSKLSTSGVRRMTAGIIGFSVIRWIMERWDDYQHSKYLKNKKFQEWLQNQAALLSMELQSVDPSDPKYIRLQKLIEAYNTEIAKYDKMIAEYEKE